MDMKPMGLNLGKDEDDESEEKEGMRKKKSDVVRIGFVCYNL